MKESAVLLSELERENLKLPEDYNKGKFTIYILDREKTVEETQAKDKEVCFENV